MLCGSTVFREEPSEGGSVQKIVEIEDSVPIFLNKLWNKKENCHTMNASCLPQIKGRDLD